MDEQKSLESDSLELLKTIPLFHSFSTQQDKLSALAALMTKRTVKKGSFLIQEGEIGKEMFILEKGEVEITKRTLENEQYTVAVLREQDHAFFGELALMDEDKRSATIKALRECDVLVLKRDDFETLGNSNPDIGLNIMRELAKIVCRRFRSTNQDVILLFEALVHEVSTAEID